MLQIWLLVFNSLSKSKTITLKKGMSTTYSLINDHAQASTIRDSICPKVS